MTKKNTVSPSQPMSQLKRGLLIAGVALTFGWAIAVALLPFLYNFCGSFAGVCIQNTQLANLVIDGPLAIGSVLLPIGVVYDEEMSRLAKFLVVLIAGIILFFLGYYLTTFLGIALHGLQG